MPKTVTIVMYHYIRDLEHSRYPNIKGLTVDHFTEQLEYMAQYYTFVTVEQLIDALDSPETELPPNAIMLTFDDGYIDHFLTVFPLLNRLGIQGCFFPTAKAVLEQNVLDVNKIHFILATADDHSAIVRDIYSMMDQLRPTHALESNEYYYRTHAQAKRYDSPDVAFIKTILQKALPEKCREYIVDRLFRNYVGVDESVLSDELYMSLNQLRCMSENGMYIGSHSYEHIWMDSLSPAAQRADVESSKQFCQRVGCDLNQWGFNYPYGAFDDSLISLLRAGDCKFALTSKVGIADLEVEDRLMLPRLDTNDLPKDRGAKPNDWTLKVIS